jgi:NADH-ubiquinone oxidoreductase chain 5
LWEGIGVASYLLINFWWTRIQANKASILAFTMNRVGDMGLSIGFLALFTLFGSLDYSTIFSLAPFLNETSVTVIGLFLLIGAMAKSAQIPLHSWLPGSMEGPTPVSALIHAATLVTAGLYLLVRCSTILEYSPTTLLVITLVGSTTAFVGALCGLVQNDIKRIIAFSTISQLGYMVLAVGISKYDVSLFHVINHAFFKALLFLSAGSVIHSMADQQDIRRLGGLIKFLPFTYTIMLVGSLSLLATPWLSGFYSKDLIIELGYAHYGFSGYYAYVLGSITAGLTAFYSFRLISLTFLTYPNAKRVDYLNSHEATIIVIIPLTILALFSIFFGYLTSDLFVGMATDFFGNSIYLHPNYISIVEAEFSLPHLIKLLPAILSLIGAIIGILLYHINKEFIISITDPIYNTSIYKDDRVSLPYNFYGLINSHYIKIGKLKFSSEFTKIIFNLKLSKEEKGPYLRQFWLMISDLSPTLTSLHKLESNNKFINGILIGKESSYSKNYFNNNNLYSKIVKVKINGMLARKFYLFLNAKFLFDILYNKYIISEGLNLGFKVFKSLDKGLVENIGPFGLANVFYNTSKNISKADTGVVTTYSLYICLGILIILFLGYSPLYIDSFLLMEKPGIELSNIFKPDVITNVDIFINNNLNLEEMDKSSLFFQPERLLIIYLGSLLLIYQQNFRTFLNPYPNIISK